MQQMALAKLIFDGVMERFPRLRFGFLEAGVGWLPDLMHSLHEHWEKRILNFDPTLEPSVAEFLLEFGRERDSRGRRGTLRKASRLMRGLFVARPERPADRSELEAFWHEHPKLCRDPLDYLKTGQIFLSVEPDDPAPQWLPAALGKDAKRLCGLAVDYGHWDATLKDCVSRISDHPAIDDEYRRRLLSDNALEFYGERLERRIDPSSVAPSSAMARA
jgi:hypothetical protein